ncbi:ECF RNA polymerase sigma factor SigK [Amycolatopsis sp. cmx-4-68]|uniref:ECF RNA polymerase sigma factor SigK n=1 Tax=Amycolatopsis sp. cmx-4-68 TaxID=2790938 RepID=UPI00397A98B8
MVTRAPALHRAHSTAETESPPTTAETLMAQVALGDENAFAALYDMLAGPILGITTRVLRNRSLAEEVTQEVLLEIWRTATRFSAHRGSVMTWAMTVAHRRAIDRVRSVQAAADRDDRAEQLELRQPYDEVLETTLETLDRERVRRALAGLTDLQRQSIQLAYYRGYSYPEVAELLGTPLSTIKTRMRDGLIRLRDALGVLA